MKKLFIVLVAVLLVGSVTVAQAYFGIADPKTTEGAANVKVPVYNNSGGALDEGDVVVWQIGSSTGDNDLYVTTTVTANTGLVAGVVAQGGIASASSGVIIVYGLAQCDVTVAAAGTLLCTSAVAGSGGLCTAPTDEPQAYAITSTTGSKAQVDCFVIQR
jgi:hypothetical protein